MNLSPVLATQPPAISDGRALMSSPFANYQAAILREPAFSRVKAASGNGSPLLHGVNYSGLVQGGPVHRSRQIELFLRLRWATLRQRMGRLKPDTPVCRAPARHRVVECDATREEKPE